MEVNFMKWENKFEILFIESVFCLKKGMSIKKSVNEILEKRKTQIEE